MSQNSRVSTFKTQCENLPKMTISRPYLKKSFWTCFWRRFLVSFGALLEVESGLILGLENRRKKNISDVVVFANIQMDANERIQASELQLCDFILWKNRTEIAKVFAKSFLNISKVISIFFPRVSRYYI